MKKRIVLIYGRPGSGKSSLIESLRKEKDIYAIEVGRALYQVAFGGHKTDWSELVATNIMSGIPCPPSVTCQILSSAYNNISKVSTIIIDGFPRQEEDIPHFREFLNKNHLKGNDVRIIEIHVSKAEAASRAAMRQRLDDSADVLSKRMAQYENYVSPLIARISQIYSHTRIDASRSFDLVCSEFLTEIRA